MDSKGFTVDLSVGSGDCLVLMFPLLAKLHERGASLPFIFPETVCYEHHFPRGWYYFEREASKKLGPSGGAGDGGAAGTGVREDRDARQAQLDKLRASSPFLRPPRQAHASGSGAMDNRLNLMKKTVKECDSGTIRRMFATPPSSKSPIGSEVVVRMPSGALEVKYLNSSLLAEFLMSTPETCILSKNVPSTALRNDVIVAAWTPTVFCIEHRVNQHALTDESVSLQTRGDTFSISNYSEEQACPLLATRIREAMQQLVWIVAKYERKTVVEFRAHFRPDSRANSAHGANKKCLWFLWADVFRVVDIAKPSPSLPTSGAFPPLVVGGVQLSATDFWDKVEQDEIRRQKSASCAWRCSRDEGSPMARSQRSGSDAHGGAAHLTPERSSPFSDDVSDSPPGRQRSTTAPLTLASRGLPKRRRAARGKWPSFTPTDGGVDEHVVAAVSARMEAILRAANRLSRTKPGPEAQGNGEKPKPKTHGEPKTLDGSQVRSPPAQKSTAPPSRAGGCALQPVLPLCLMPDDSSAGGRADDGDEDEELSLAVCSAGATSKSFVAGFNPSCDSCHENSHPGHAEKNSEETSVSPLHAQAAAAKEIAHRSPIVASTPSIWRKKLIAIEARHSEKKAPKGFARLDMHTPRISHAEQERQASSVRSVSFSQESLADLQLKRSELSRSYIPDPKDMEIFAPPASVASRRGSIRDRRRTSAVSFGTRDMEKMDIDDRLRFADLRRKHAASLEQLADIKYVCHSEEMRCRGAIPIFFDLPKGCPTIDRNAMKKMGFSITAENKELDATAVEEYYFLSHQKEILWSFDQLVEAVQKACNRTETAFLNVE
jgi:hypothetical protein